MCAYDYRRIDVVITKNKTRRFIMKYLEKNKVIRRIKAKQGYFKLRIPLEMVRKAPWVEEIDQPEFVYHLTEALNLESILEDGKIKSFNHFLTYFSTSPFQIAVHVRLSGVTECIRIKIRTDATLVHLQPIDVDDMVVLKLKPKRKEPMAWYREISDVNNLPGTEHTEGDRKLVSYINEASICHYGDLEFSKDEIEIIPLKNILESLSDDENRELEEIVKLNRKL